MKINYDKEIDAAYIQLSDLRPTGVVEIAEGVNLDVTESDQVVGIEILNVTQKFPLKSLFVCEYEPDLFLDTASG